MNKEINLLQGTLATIDPEESLAFIDEPPVPNREEVKTAIEALLFSSPEPVPAEKLREILRDQWPLRPRAFTQILQELQRDYESPARAFQLDEIGGGLALRTKEKFGPYVERLVGHRRGEKLSPAATEVLAIIAYRQPITRPAIEAIRGVDSSGVVASLLERDLIEVVGKLEAPGRPSLYATTGRFLQHFGLKDASSLPPIE